MKRNISLCAVVVIVLVLAGIGAAETPNRATILSDSFGKNPALTMGWGFAALQLHAFQHPLHFSPIDTGLGNFRVVDED